MTSSEYRSVSEQNIRALQKEVKTYKDAYGQTVTEKASIILTAKQLKHERDSLKHVIKNYKPEIVAKWSTKTEYKDTIIYKWKDPIPTEFTRDFTIKEKWRTLSGMVDNNGVSITHMSIPNGQSLVGGFKRDRWYKQSYASISIVNKNPYVTTSNVSSFVVKENRKFYDRWYFWAAVGLFSGIAISK